jgi:hypothetical protein
MPLLQMPTTFYRVEGPRDGRTCAFCRDWLGRVLPQEQRASFQESHGLEGTGHGCRCTFVPVQKQLDREDPSCEWA